MKKYYLLLAFFLFSFMNIDFVFAANTPELVCSYKGTYTYQKYGKDVTEDVDVTCNFYTNNSAKCSISQSGWNQKFSNWGSHYKDIFNAKEYYLNNKKCFPYVVFLDKGSLIDRYEVFAADTKEHADAISAYEKSRKSSYVTSIVQNVYSSQSTAATIYDNLDKYIDKLNKFMTAEDPWGFDSCSSLQHTTCRTKVRAFYDDLYVWEKDIQASLDSGIISSNDSKLVTFREGVQKIRDAIGTDLDSKLYKEVKQNSENEDDGNGTGGDGGNSSHGGGSNGGGNNGTGGNSGGSTEIPVNNETVSSLCQSNNFKKPLKYVGWLLSLVKIIIPLIIIVMGVIDFFKGTVSSKDDEVTHAAKHLAMRVIAGVVIFFIPAIVDFLFSLVDDWNDYKTSYSECTKCLYDPKSC